MKLGSRITDATGQLLLDIHVDILKIDGELEFSLGDFITDLIEPLLDCREFILSQKPRGLERPCMGDTPPDIMTV